MAVNDLFLSILKSENDGAVPLFLKNIPNEERPSFAKYLKELIAEYCEYKQINGSWSRKATQRHMAIFLQAIFVFQTRREFRTHGGILWVPLERINEILDWHVPKWFTEYINGLVEDRFAQHNVYHWVVSVEERGYAKPNRRVYAELLSRAIIEYKSGEFSINRDVLFQKPVTLSEHFWYMFEVESNIHDPGNYLSSTQKADDRPLWVGVIDKLVKEGDVDRNRVLRSALLATTLNFNKPATGWFSSLFEYLEPADEELLNLQSELNSVFTSKHSKAVGVSLNAIKKIIDAPGFRADSFIDSLPLLLSSETKSVVTTAISLVEKLLKNKKDKREQLCVALADCFINTDKGIQTRAANLIVKFAPVDSIIVKEAVSRFQGNLLHGTKDALADFFDDTEAPAPAVMIEEKSIDEIHLPRTFDELLFFAGQAFHSEQPQAIDILPASLIRLDKEITGTNINKLEPVLKTALEIFEARILINANTLDHLMAVFFISYCRYLITRHPQDAKDLQRLFNRFVENDKQRIAEGSRHQTKIYPLDQWGKGSHGGSVFQPYKNLYLRALRMVEERDTLPLLSTPTHAPAYLSGQVFIERLIQYQDTNKTPGSMDLEIAISRSGERSTGEISTGMLGKIQDGELKDILSFHFFDRLSPDQQFTMKGAWLAAAALKNDDVLEKVRALVTNVSIHEFNGQFKWKVFTERGRQTSYNVVIPALKRIVVDEVQKESPDQPKEKTSAIASFLSGLFKNVDHKKPDDRIPDSLYEYIILKAYNPLAAGDIPRLLFLTPGNVEPFLSQVILKWMSSNSMDSMDRASTTAVLRSLMELRVRFRPTGNLFVCLCILSAHDTIRSFAAELWVKNATNENLDSTQAGKIIAELEKEEFAPMKRFTDVVSSNMMNVSAQHNKELEKLIGEVITGLSDEPPTGLKKLLEIYHELVSINKSTPTARLKDRIAIWASNATLKKVVAAIAKVM